MDLNSIINELRTERAQLEEAIISLERFAASHHGKRRGRPPAWLTAARTENTEPKKRGRPPGSKNKVQD